MNDEYLRPGVAPPNLNTYCVWFVPTERGVEAFKWKKRLLYETPSKDDADEFAYLEDADETAPDKREYRTIEVTKAPVKLEWWTKHPLTQQMVLVCDRDYVELLEARIEMLSKPVRRP